MTSPPLRPWDRPTFGTSRETLNTSRATQISQLADIERERDEVLIRESMVTPVCAHVGFDSMGCGCKSACCKRISKVKGHLWTGLRNSASSLQITTRLGASHATFRARKLETGLDANQA